MFPFQNPGKLSILSYNNNSNLGQYILLAYARGLMLPLEGPQCQDENMVSFKLEELFIWLILICLAAAVLGIIMFALWISTYRF
jgi:hypothetical protein